MTSEEIMDGLKEVIVTIRPNVDTTSITAESLLLEDIGLDSLTMLLMSLAIENKFGIRFDGPVQLKKVQDVIDCVLQKLA